MRPARWSTRRSSKSRVWPNRRPNTSIEPEQAEPVAAEILTDPPAEPRKFYIDGGEVEVIGHLVYDLDTDGKKLQVVRYTEYSGRAVRSLYPDARRAAIRLGRPRRQRPTCCVELTERGIELRGAGGEQRPARCRPVRPALPPGLERPVADAAPARRARAQGHAGPVCDSYGDTARECCRCCSTSTSSGGSSSSMRCPT